MTDPEGENNFIRSFLTQQWIKLKGGVTILHKKHECNRNISFHCVVCFYDI